VNVIEYASLISVLAPLIILLLAQSHWGSKAKGVVVAVVCIAGGSGSVYFGGGNFADLAVTIPAVLVASQMLYHTFFRPTGIAPWLEQLTDLATFFGKLAAAAEKPKP
jgi:hypothetical protein